MLRRITAGDAIRVGARRVLTTRWGIRVGAGRRALRLSGRWALRLSGWLALGLAAPIRLLPIRVRAVGILTVGTAGGNRHY